MDKICILNEDDGYSREGGSSGRGYSREGGSSGRGYSREGGSSGRGYSREGGNYSNRGSYRGGSSYDGYSEEASYARRRRDRMGRYSREDGKEHMMHQLGEMMRNANEHEREALERCMSELNRGD